jgi:Tfp pilus assembly protein PilO
MNKLSKEKREKLILVVLLTVGVLAGFYYFIIADQKQTISQVESKIASTSEKLDKAQRWLRMGETIQAELAARRKQLDEEHDQLAPLDRFKWFHGTLTQFLPAYNVRLVDITREPEVGPVGSLPNFPYEAARFGVKLSATYHEFGKFLADFENHFRLMRVQNVELAPEALSRTSTQSQAADERLAITIRVVTLIRPTARL